jgi:hypothetical protein
MNTTSRKSSEFPSKTDVLAFNSKAADAEITAIDEHRIGIFPMHSKADPKVSLDKHLIKR